MQDQPSGPRWGSFDIHRHKLFFAVIFWPVRRRQMGSDSADTSSETPEKLKRPMYRGRCGTRETRPRQHLERIQLALDGAATFTEDSNPSLHRSGSHADRAMMDGCCSRKGVMDGISQGAQRSNGRYPYDWNSGSRMELLPCCPAGGRRRRRFHKPGSGRKPVVHGAVALLPDVFSSPEVSRKWAALLPT